MLAVSNYDTDARVADLPRVGDYLNIDWERLAQLESGTLLMQQNDPAVNERAEELGVRVKTVPIHTLADIEDAVITCLAALVADATFAHDRDSSVQVSKRTSDWIFALRCLRNAEFSSRVPTLLVCGDRSLCAGRGTYLDELLTLAGGVNVLAGEGYLEPDDERVAVLAPEVILVLLPEGDAAAVRGRWERFGARVEIIERADALVPGWNVVEIGEAMRAVLVERRPEGALRGSGRTDPRLRGLSLRLQGHGLRLQGVVS
ncbi:MAG: hypothetical protein AAF656_09040 [Planctomycetota bacterium]